MFFILSKIVFFFLRPSHVFILFAFLGCFLLFSRFWYIGRIMVCVAVLCLAIAGLSPLGNILIAPLESRFLPPQLQTLHDIDGLIVLGGALDPKRSERHDGFEVNAAAERLMIIPRLARVFPDIPIVFTGGSGRLIEASHLSEAMIAARIFEGFGLEKRRLLFEDQSRNTWENARFTFDMMQPGKNSRWLIVTSAYHMPRVIGCFRRAGFRHLIAYPVDYRGKRGKNMWMPVGALGQGLQRVDIAVREWIGLLVYWLSGKNIVFFPAP